MPIVRALMHNGELGRAKRKVKICKKPKKVRKLKQAKVNQITFKSLNECFQISFYCIIP